MEQNEILGEMQFGSRKDWKGEDANFILTSAIDISRQEETGLMTCFLDCSRTYDCIDRRHL